MSATMSQSQQRDMVEEVFGKMFGGVASADVKKARRDGFEAGFTRAIGEAVQLLRKERKFEAADQVSKLRLVKKPGA